VKSPDSLSIQVARIFYKDYILAGTQDVTTTIYCGLIWFGLTSLGGSRGPRNLRPPRGHRSQAMAWIFVVGHALNLLLNKVLQHQYTASELRPRSLGKEIRPHNFGKGVHRHTGPGSQTGQVFWGQMPVWLPIDGGEGLYPLSR
jgi:hypothetical protein